MRILLTGATGFLGSCILRRLIESNYDTVILKRSHSNIFRIKEVIGKVTYHDIDKFPLESVFEESRYDVIIHTATQYGRKDENLLDIVETNLMLPLRLITLGLKHNVRTFINTDTLLDKRINSYSLSKHQFKNWLSIFSDRIECINVLLEHFYGQNDDKTKFVTFVINSLINNERELNLTPGEQRRDFLYIDDVVDAFMLIIQAADMRSGFHEYEVGSGVNIRIKDFVEAVARISGNVDTRLNFGAIPYRENEVMESRVNLRAIEELGWTPKTSLEQGLRQTIQFEMNKI